MKVNLKCPDCKQLYYIRVSNLKEAHKIKRMYAKRIFTCKDCARYIHGVRVAILTSKQAQKYTRRKNSKTFYIADAHFGLTPQPPSIAELFAGSADKKLKLLDDYASPFHIHSIER